MLHYSSRELMDNQVDTFLCDKTYDTMAPMNEFGQPVGFPLPEWKGAKLPERRTLEGKFCYLEPVSAEKHSEQLYAAYSLAKDARHWTYLYAGPFECHTDFRAYIKSLEDLKDYTHYAVVDKKTERAVGSVALMRVNPADGSIEVGSISFSPLLQKTRAGTEVIAILLNYVFRHLGYRRFEWKCDALNEPSRRAATRFEFTFEGVFRQAAVVRGRNRDTAWYSIIDSEALCLLEGYEKWLCDTNFDDKGAQIFPLRHFLSAK